MNLYWPNGNRQCETICIDGKSKELRTWWYDNGNKWYDVHLANTKKCGLLETWFRNGTVHYKMTYKKDIEHGAMIDFKYGR